MKRLATMKIEWAIEDLTVAAIAWNGAPYAPGPDEIQAMRAALDAALARYEHVVCSAGAVVRCA